MNQKRMRGMMADKGKKTRYVKRPDGVEVFIPLQNGSVHHIGRAKDFTTARKMVRKFMTKK